MVHPCKNDGKCMDPSVYEDYKCICLKGFTGKHCEISENLSKYAVIIFK